MRKDKCHDAVKWKWDIHTFPTLNQINEGDIIPDMYLPLQMTRLEMDGVD